MDHSFSNSPSLSSDSPYVATAADAPIVMYSLSDSYSSQNLNKSEEETNKNEDVTSKNVEAPYQMEAERAEQIKKPTQNPKVSTKRRVKIRSGSSSEEENQEKANDREKTSDQEEANLVSISNLALEDERVRRRSETERGSNLPRNLKEIIEASSGDLDENRNAEMDIMEVGKMKMQELETERPSWHRVGGYPDV